MKKVSLKIFQHICQISSVKRQCGLEVNFVEDFSLSRWKASNANIDSVVYWSKIQIEKLIMASFISSMKRILVRSNAKDHTFYDKNDKFGKLFSFKRNQDIKRSCRK